MGEEADFETPFLLVDAEEQMRAVLSKLEAHCYLTGTFERPKNISDDHGGRRWFEVQLRQRKSTRQTSRTCGCRLKS